MRRRRRTQRRSRRPETSKASCTCVRWPRGGGDAPQALPRDQVLYSNRSACRLKLERQEDALRDAELAIECNPSYAKVGASTRPPPGRRRASHSSASPRLRVPQAYFRRASCLKAMGRLRDARVCCAAAVDRLPEGERAFFARQVALYSDAIRREDKEVRRGGVGGLVGPWARLRSGSELTSRARWVSEWCVMWETGPTSSATWRVRPPPPRSRRPIVGPAPRDRDGRRHQAAAGHHRLLLEPLDPQCVWGGSGGPQLSRLTPPQMSVCRFLIGSWPSSLAQAVVRRPPRT